MNKTIKIKSERAPIVKSEHDMNSAPFETTTVRCGPENVVDDLEETIKTLSMEKDKLIKEVVLSQEENQKLYIDLQNKQKIIVALEGDEKRLKEKVSSQAQRITQLVESQQKEIAQLVREKNALQAKIKQLMACVSSQKKVESTDESDEDVYEVETILKHEVKKGARRFLIRWKNFSPSHDSWEKESNLNCPQILKDYLHAKGSK